MLSKYTYATYTHATFIEKSIRIRHLTSLILLPHRFVLAPFKRRIRAGTAVLRLIMDERLINVGLVIREKRYTRPSLSVYGRRIGVDEVVCLRFDIVRVPCSRGNRTK